MATKTEIPQTFNKEEVQRHVQHPLQLVRTYIRNYIILEGVALTLLCGIGLFWLGLALDYGLFHFDFPLIKVYGVDWIFEFNEIDDSGVSSLVCRIMVLALIAIGLAVLGFSKVVVRWMSDFNDQAIALVLERRFPNQLGDRLITAVELSDPKLAAKYGFSQAMIEKTIMEAVDLIKTLPVSLVFNWGRLAWLWVFVVLSSVGMLAANMAVFTSASAMFSDKWISPSGFTWRFYHVASIWTERNVFMMDTYWPRRAHLEITGFQPSRTERPTDMRVAKDDKRPELRVRAFQWVVADRSAPSGWRPLRWKDLPGFLPDDVVKAVNIPKDFPHWKLELDELEPELLNAMYKESEIPVTQWSGEFREHRKDPEVKRKVKGRNGDARLDTWLDWTEWTVDKLGVQKENVALRDPNVVKPAQAASTVGLLAFPTVEGRMLAGQGLFPGRTDHTADPAPLERVFAELEKLADDPSMGRTLRKLALPTFVEVNFRGEGSASTDFHKKLAGNKYAVSLMPLKESTEFTFRARGENYFTPKKTISLIPAPTASAIYTDTIEPAYRYHRLFGVNQMALRGQKHIKRNEARSTSGSGNDFRLAGGGAMAIHVVIDNTPIAWAGMRVMKLAPHQREPLTIPATQGLLVTRVEPNSPAHQVKLQVNDVLLKFNGALVPSNPEKFADMVREKIKNPETTIEFTVLRGGKEETTQARAMPADLVYLPRKLREERPIPEPERPQAESKYKGFPGKIQVHDDRFGFSLIMDNIVDNHEFAVEFYDEDNIRGTRRFKIDQVGDEAPFVDALGLGYAGRHPKFRTIGDASKKKAKGKDGDPDEMRDYSEYAKAYLITPDAKLPFQCKVADVYGLVRVGYRYKYEKIDFELVQMSGSKKLPVMQIGAEKHIYRARAVVPMFQFWPGNPSAWHLAPSFMAYASDMVELDVRFSKGYREGFVPSAGFEDEVKARADEMVNLPGALARMAKGIGKPRAWEFDFKTQEPEGFDVQKHLPELKADKLSSIGQMHYLLKIAVEATDNNVEGTETFIHSHWVKEVNAQGGAAKVKRSETLNGSTQINKNGDISFIVISENELLAQIALDEEALKEKLESAKEVVDAGMVSLREQQSKIQVKDADLEGILGRLNGIRTGVGKAGEHLIRAQQTYEEILKEMDVNRVKSQRVKDIQDKIITQLDHIVNPPTQRLPKQGSLPIAQESFLRAQQLVEDEKDSKRAPDLARHEQNMTKAYDDLDRLSKEIQLVLNAMGDGIVESKLIALLASIERQQRERSRFFRLQWELEQERLLDILMGKGKDKDKKDPDKKDEKKDLKRSSMLQSSEIGGRFAWSANADADFRRPSPRESPAFRGAKGDDALIVRRRPNAAVNL